MANHRNCSFPEISLEKPPLKNMKDLSRMESNQRLAIGREIGLEIEQSLWKDSLPSRMDFHRENRDIASVVQTHPERLGNLDC